MPTLTAAQVNIRLYQNPEGDPLALRQDEEHALLTGGCYPLGSAHDDCNQRGWMDISHDIMVMLFRPGSGLSPQQKTRLRALQDAEGLVEMKVDLDRGRLYIRTPGSDDNYACFFPFVRFQEDEDPATPDTTFAPLHKELFDLCADVRRPTLDDDDSEASEGGSLPPPCPSIDGSYDSHRRIYFSDRSSSAHTPHQLTELHTRTPENRPLTGSGSDSTNYAPSPRPAPTTFETHSLPIPALDTLQRLRAEHIRLLAQHARLEDEHAAAVEQIRELRAWQDVVTAYVDTAERETEDFLRSLNDRSGRN